MLAARVLERQLELLRRSPRTADPWRVGNYPTGGKGQANLRRRYGVDAATWRMRDCVNAPRVALSNVQRGGVTMQRARTWAVARKRALVLIATGAIVAFAAVPAA